MSATIIMFPARAGDLGPAVCMEIHTVEPAPISASALAAKFADHFLPICQASVDLLEADEHDFEARCRRMLDADGTSMIDELCAELAIVGEQMQLIVDGLELTRVRVRTAMGQLTKADQKLL